MLTTLSLTSSWFLLPVPAPTPTLSYARAGLHCLVMLEPVPIGGCQNMKAGSLCQVLFP